MIKKIFTAAALLMSAADPLYAQYINLQGENPAITEYVEANENNWNKSVMYVFYSNTPCALCSQAMGMIYDIYEQYYLNQFSLFEINYEDNDEYGMRISYELDSPLSVVLVRIQDGQSRGWYKIENPQYYVQDPFYFKEKMLTEINNFLNT